MAVQIKNPKLKAPFPWFGGKSRVAAEVWSRFGIVANYVEPFAGSLAVLLGRESAPRVETVNDLDCWIANFWRALQADPEALAGAVDWPVNEADLHARHQWLVNQVEWRERLKKDPDFFDMKVAGWWVWGICQWIGSGWCAAPGWTGRTNAGRAARGINTVWEVRPAALPMKLNNIPRKRPSAARENKGLLSTTVAKRPLLSSNGGRNLGVLKNRKLNQSRPHIAHHIGIHKLSQQIPDLSGNSGASGRGIHASSESQSGLVDWLFALADRLRRVRVCCGDWSRVVTPSVTFKIGLTGVFLDPPYDMAAVAGTNSKAKNLYSQHDSNLSARVCDWAIKNGGNPLMRIALCGYKGEHELPDDWECLPWKANGGFGNQSKTSNGRTNARCERIWFSPHCLRTSRLFD